MRAAAARLLDDWQMEEEAFTLELILSELVTNAIRHAGPIGVRLIRDRSLICEVSDGSSVSPHLRRATTMDEKAAGASSWWPSSPTAGRPTHPAERSILDEQQLSAIHQPTAQAPPSTPPPA